MNALTAEKRDFKDTIYTPQMNPQTSGLKSDKRRTDSAFIGRRGHTTQIAHLRGNGRDL